MKILISGNRGFVGTATQKILEENNHEIIGYDLMEGYDIRDRDQLEAVVKIERPDRILHLAAIARFAEADANPLLAHETNVIGTMNVVGIAAKYHIPLVHASTGSTYMPIEQEPPITEDFKVRGNSVYGSTKAMAEKYVEKHNPHIILRYAHLYGAEKRMHGLIGGFIDRIMFGMAPVLYGGKQSNDFTYILDVARANMLALTAPWDKWNNAYNIGTGEELSAEDAGKMICDVMGYKGEIIRKEQRTVDPQRFAFSCEKAKKMLGFVAEYDFKKGLQHMMETAPLEIK